MCVLSIKVPIRKKSVNLFNDPRIYIYIYIYCVCVNIYIYIYIYIYSHTQYDINLYKNYRNSAQCMTYECI